MTLAQLTQLASEHHVHPDLLSTNTLGALFDRFVDSSTGGSPSLSCRGFCGWLAGAAAELIGSLGDLCDTPKGRLELLLSKMDERGALFGGGLRERQSGALQALNHREAKWQAARSAQQHAQQRRFGTPGADTDSTPGRRRKQFLVPLG